MRSSEVVILWKDGLHARPASRLVRTAQRFASDIRLRFNGNVANARSIISVMLLCATVGASISVEVEGDDEEKAIQAVQQVFVSGDY
jgi:phosphocarrier protein HPr